MLDFALSPNISSKSIKGNILSGNKLLWSDVNREHPTSSANWGMD
jgi:hypothetical protein